MNRTITSGDDAKRPTDPASGDGTRSRGQSSERSRFTFEQVAAEHAPMIRRIAASHEANTHLAQDLIQEILFALWKALPSFRGEGSMRAFVARIATNRAVSHVKQAIRLNEGGEITEQLPMPGETPESRVVALDQNARLLAAVRSLPFVYRQVVMLTLEGLKGEEIASVLGISANAVAIRMSRAKDMLRVRLRG
ncbi:MAG TPA: RNA polymerase sigma factor [Steroidobacteraceae bacterium]|nr:RNA polymerase sigma factor [Steroidobacteraceae bacterium]